MSSDLPYDEKHMREYGRMMNPEGTLPEEDSITRKQKIGMILVITAVVVGFIIMVLIFMYLVPQGCVAGGTTCP